MFSIKNTIKKHVNFVVQEKKLGGKTESNSCEAKPVLILLDNTDSENSRADNLCPTKDQGDHVF